MGRLRVQGPTAPLEKTWVGCISGNAPKRPEGLWGREHAQHVQGTPRNLYLPHPFTLLREGVPGSTGPIQ